ncbi:hypothetical protein [Parvibium lacunae]|uniref:Uncharacterized protein n=1 Tax=Parvibium lacunae TaxID=1888893 RepID=A0A368L3L4_9BURK|nr:hypothetical protein [Parvibium lacunae]RCS58073.1 hypothetical protein DU000_04325 [Parvibium lacunae]
MPKKTVQITLSRGMPGHAILDPVLDYLLAQGNQLATSYRWASNPTGLVAVVRFPINFNQLEEEFDFPPDIILDKKYGCIDYGYGQIVIRSSS